jgi:AraC-like DNA-binding protein
MCVWFFALFFVHRFQLQVEVLQQLSFRLESLFREEEVSFEQMPRTEAARRRATYVKLSRDYQRVQAQAKNFMLEEKTRRSQQQRQRQQQQQLRVTTTAQTSHMNPSLFSTTTTTLDPEQQVLLQLQIQQDVSLLLDQEDGCCVLPHRHHHHCSCFSHSSHDPIYILFTIPVDIRN